MTPLRVLAVLGLLAALAPSAAAEEGPVRLTLNPTIVKGSPTAPVTLVEFSDYQ